MHAANMDPLVAYSFQNDRQPGRPFDSGCLAPLIVLPFPLHRLKQVFRDDRTGYGAAVHDFGRRRAQDVN